MSTLSTNVHTFRTELAPAHALDALQNSLAEDWHDLEAVTRYTDSGDYIDLAHELADSAEAVIYFSQALALYASGYLDDVDADDHAFGINEGSAQATIDKLVTALSYEWHRAEYATALESALLSRCAYLITQKATTRF